MPLEEQAGDKSKLMTSQWDQSPTDGVSVSLAQLKDLAEKLAAVGDEMTQTYSQKAFIIKRWTLLNWDTLERCACSFMTGIAKELLWCRNTEMNKNYIMLDERFRHETKHWALLSRTKVLIRENFILFMCWNTMHWTDKLTSVFFTDNLQSELSILKISITLM